MTRTLTGFSRAAALAVCALATTQAYAANLPSVSMNVPFDFVVSGKTLPAGEYSVNHANASSGPVTFVIRSVKTRKGVYAVMAQRGAADRKAKSAQAIFACRDQACYLHEIKVPGSDSYIGTLPRFSAAQKERLAALNMEPRP